MLTVTISMFPNNIFAQKELVSQRSEFFSFGNTNANAKSLYSMWALLNESYEELERDPRFVHKSTFQVDV